MLTPSKYLIVTIFFIYTYHEAVAFGNTYLEMFCQRFGQIDTNKCKYGHEINIICNKAQCKAGPDEECTGPDELNPLGKHCGDKLHCVCGFCQGCSMGVCDTRMCGTQIKRTPSKQLWIMELYRQQKQQQQQQQMQQQQQQQDEQHRLQEFLQQQQQDIRRPMMMMPSPKEFINVKSLLDRISYYPFNSSAEINFSN